MKKVIIYIAASLMALTGCSGFLEVENPGKNDIPKFFSNMDGLILAESGLYELLYSFCDNDYTKYGDLAGDMVKLVTSTSMYDQYAYESKPENSAGTEANIWRSGYEIIANANYIVRYAPQLKEEFPSYSGEIDQIYASALFVRALTHLMICNSYAQPYNYTSDASHLGVTVVRRIVGTNESLGRDRTSAVYQSILDDLTEALGIFGEPVAPASENESYYITARACKALQARVYLYMGRNDLARDCATELINLMQLTPREDYVDMMKLVDDNKPGRESIFRLSGFGHTSHRLASFYLVKDEGIPAAATDKLTGTFVYPNDIRRSLIETNNEITKYCNPLLKGIEAPPSNDKIPYGVHILRLSEMYLIRAEAYCQLDQLSLAEADLKEIIGRAIGEDPASVTLSYSGKDGLLEMIDRERILEFFGEGHRLFDIVRRKQDMERDANNIASGHSAPLKITYPNNYFVLPIPRLETGINSAIEQNPGYTK